MTFIKMMLALRNMPMFFPLVLLMEMGNDILSIGLNSSKCYSAITITIIVIKTSIELKRNHLTPYKSS